MKKVRRRAVKGIEIPPPYQLKYKSNGTAEISPYAKDKNHRFLKEYENHRFLEKGKYINHSLKNTGEKTCLVKT